MNPGGLRKDLLYASSGDTTVDPDGNVTYREAADVQPFANTLVALDLTGAQVVQVLEEQWQPAGASRPFLKLGVAGLDLHLRPDRRRRRAHHPGHGRRHRRSTRRPPTG